MKRLALLLLLLLGQRSQWFRENVFFFDGSKHLRFGKLGPMVWIHFLPKYEVRLWLFGLDWRRRITLLLCLLLCLLLPSAASALSPEDAVLAALKDLDQQAREDQVFLHYLFLPDSAAASLAAFTPALRLHVNKISTEASLAYPAAIIPGLWRVDERDYGWQKRNRIFDQLGKTDPYFHRNQAKDVIVERVVRETVYIDEEYYVYDYYGRAYRQVRQVPQVRERIVREKKRQRSRQLYVPQGAGQLASLALLTQSDAPIVRADWFLVQGARQLSLTNRNNTGVGYYDWLGLKTLDDYFQLIGRDARAAQRTQIRAVVGESGVTAQNRQITSEGVANGGLWTTFEVADQSGRGVAIQELRDGEFDTVASEFYAPLLNGLPATFLANNQGVRQDSVPDTIAHNDAPLNISRDKRVHINIACDQCHLGQVLQPIADDVRSIYTGRLSVLTNDKKVQLELSRQYGANLNARLERDRGLYQDVVTLITGKNPKDAFTAYSDAFTRYAYARVTRQQAALELGVPEKALVKALQDGATRLGRGDFRFDTFLTDTPGTVPRLNFEDGFQDLQDTLYGILNDNPSVNDGGVGGGAGGARIKRKK